MRVHCFQHVAFEGLGSIADWLTARGIACENQAFQVGARVIGLQFHLETTPESARALVAHCRADLRPATYVQSDQAILSAPDRHYSAANALMNAVLLHLAETEG